MKSHSQPEAEEGMVFVGWYLGNDENTLYLPTANKKVTISKESIVRAIESAGLGEVIEYDENTHIGTIKLKAKFIDAAEAARLQYEVHVTVEGAETEFFEYGPFYGTSADNFSVSQAVVLGQPGVKEKDTELLGEGYILDINRSDSSIELNDESEHVFNLIYIGQFQDVVAKNAEGQEDLGHIYHNNKDVTGEILKVNDQGTVVFEIEPAENYTIDTISANGETISVDPENYSNGKYSYSYTVGNDGNEIIVSYADDKNNDDIPDDDQTLTITFDAGEGTFTDGEQKHSGTYLPGDPYPGKMLVGWFKEDQKYELTGNVDKDQQTDTWTYIAKYAVDENGDKEPDENQFKVIFKVDPTDYEFVESEAIKAALENKKAKLDKESGTLTFWYSKDEELREEPDVNDIDKTDGETFDYFVNEENESQSYDQFKGTEWFEANGSAAFIVKTATDGNNDGKPNRRKQRRKAG